MNKTNYNLELKSQMICTWKVVGRYFQGQHEGRGQPGDGKSVLRFLKVSHLMEETEYNYQLNLDANKNIYYNISF